MSNATIQSEGMELLISIRNSTKPLSEMESFLGRATEQEKRQIATAGLTEIVEQHLASEEHARDALRVASKMAFNDVVESNILQESTRLLSRSMTPEIDKLVSQLLFKFLREKTIQTNLIITTLSDELFLVEKLKKSLIRHEDLGTKAALLSVVLLCCNCSKPLRLVQVSKIPELVARLLSSPDIDSSAEKSVVVVQVIERSIQILSTSCEVVSSCPQLPQLMIAIASNASSVAIIQKSLRFLETVSSSEHAKSLLSQDLLPKIWEYRLHDDDVVKTLSISTCLSLTIFLPTHTTVSCDVGISVLSTILQNSISKNPSETVHDERVVITAVLSALSTGASSRYAVDALVKNQTVLSNVNSLFETHPYFGELICRIRCKISRSLTQHGDGKTHREMLTSWMESCIKYCNKNEKTEERSTILEMCFHIASLVDDGVHRFVYFGGIDNIIIKSLSSTNNKLTKGIERLWSYRMCSLLYKEKTNSPDEKLYTESLAKVLLESIDELYKTFGSSLFVPHHLGSCLNAIGLVFSTEDSLKLLAQSFETTSVLSIIISVFNNSKSSVFSFDTITSALSLVQKYVSRIKHSPSSFPELKQLIHSCSIPIELKRNTSMDSNKQLMLQTYADVLHSYVVQIESTDEMLMCKDLFSSDAYPLRCFSALNEFLKNDDILSEKLLRIALAVPCHCLDDVMTMSCIASAIQSYKENKNFKITQSTLQLFKRRLSPQSIGFFVSSGGLKVCLKIYEESPDDHLTLLLIASYCTDIPEPRLAHEAVKSLRGEAVINAMLVQELTLVTNRSKAVQEKVTSAWIVAAIVAGECSDFRQVVTQMAFSQLLSSLPIVLSNYSTVLSTTSDKVSPNALIFFLSSILLSPESINLITQKENFGIIQSILSLIPSVDGDYSASIFGPIAYFCSVLINSGVNELLDICLARKVDTFLSKIVNEPEPTRETDNSYRTWGRQVKLRVRMAAVNLKKMRIGEVNRTVTNISEEEKVLLDVDGLLVSRDDPVLQSTVFSPPQSSQTVVALLSDSNYQLTVEEASSIQFDPDPHSHFETALSISADAPLHASRLYACLGKLISTRVLESPHLLYNQPSLLSLDSFIESPLLDVFSKLDHDTEVTLRAFQYFIELFQFSSDDSSGSMLCVMVESASTVAVKKFLKIIFSDVILTSSHDINNIAISCAVVMSEICKEQMMVDLILTETSISQSALLTKKEQNISNLSLLIEQSSSTTLRSILLSVDESSGCCILKRCCFYVKNTNVCKAVLRCLDCCKYFSVENLSLEGSANTVAECVVDSWSPQVSEILFKIMSLHSGISDANSHNQISPTCLRRLIEGAFGPPEDIATTDLVIISHLIILLANHSDVQFAVSKIDDVLKARNGTLQTSLFSLKSLNKLLSSVVERDKIDELPESMIQVISVVVELMKSFVTCSSFVSEVSVMFNLCLTHTNLVRHEDLITSFIKLLCQGWLYSITKSKHQNFEDYYENLNVVFQATNTLTTFLSQDSIRQLTKTQFKTFKGTTIILNTLLFITWYFNNKNPNNHIGNHCIRRIDLLIATEKLVKQLCSSALTDYRAVLTMKESFMPCVLQLLDMIIECRDIDMAISMSNTLLEIIINCEVNQEVLSTESRFNQLVSRGVDVSKLSIDGKTTEKQLFFQTIILSIMTNVISECENQPIAIDAWIVLAQKCITNTSLSIASDSVTNSIVSVADSFMKLTSDSDCCLLIVPYLLLDSSQNIICLLFNTSVSYILGRYSEDCRQLEELLAKVVDTYKIVIKHQLESDSSFLLKSDQSVNSIEVSLHILNVLQKNKSIHLRGIVQEALRCLSLLLSSSDTNSFTSLFEQFTSTMCKCTITYAKSSAVSLVQKSVDCLVQFPKEAFFPSDYESICRCSEMQSGNPIIFCSLLRIMTCWKIDIDMLHGHGIIASCVNVMSMNKGIAEYTDIVLSVKGVATPATAVMLIILASCLSKSDEEWKNRISNSILSHAQWQYQNQNDDYIPNAGLAYALSTLVVSEEDSVESGSECIDQIISMNGLEIIATGIRSQLLSPQQQKICSEAVNIIKTDSISKAEDLGMSQDQLCAEIRRLRSDLDHSKKTELEKSLNYTVIEHELANLKQQADDAKLLFERQLSSNNTETEIKIGVLQKEHKQQINFLESSFKKDMDALKTLDVEFTLKENQSLSNEVATLQKTLRVVTDSHNELMNAKEESFAKTLRETQLEYQRQSNVSNKQRDWEMKTLQQERQNISDKETDMISQETTMRTAYEFNEVNSKVLIQAYESRIRELATENASLTRNIETLEVDLTKHESSTSELNTIWEKKIKDTLESERSKTQQHSSNQILIFENKISIIRQQGIDEIRLQKTIHENEICVLEYQNLENDERQSIKKTENDDFNAMVRLFIKIATDTATTITLNTHQSEMSEAVVVAKRPGLLWKRRLERIKTEVGENDVMECYDIDAHSFQTHQRNDLIKQEILLRDNIILSEKSNSKDLRKKKEQLLSNKANTDRTTLWQQAQAIMSTKSAERESEWKNHATKLEQYTSQRIKEMQESAERYVTQVRDRNKILSEEMSQLQLENKTQKEQIQQLSTKAKTLNEEIDKCKDCYEEKIESLVSIHKQQTKDQTNTNCSLIESLEQVCRDNMKGVVDTVIERTETPQSRPQSRQTIVQTDFYQVQQFEKSTEANLNPTIHYRNQQTETAPTTPEIVERVVKEEVQIETLVYKTDPKLISKNTILENEITELKQQLSSIRRIDKATEQVISDLVAEHDLEVHSLRKELSAEQERHDSLRCRYVRAEEQLDIKMQMAQLQLRYKSILCENEVLKQSIKKFQENVRELTHKEETLLRRLDQYVHCRDQLESEIDVANEKHKNVLRQLETTKLDNDIEIERIAKLHQDELSETNEQIETLQTLLRSSKYISSTIPTSDVSIDPILNQEPTSVVNNELESLRLSLLSERAHRKELESQITSLTKESEVALTKQASAVQKYVKLLSTTETIRIKEQDLERFAWEVGIQERELHRRDKKLTSAELEFFRRQSVHKRKLEPIPNPTTPNVDNSPWMSSTLGQVENYFATGREYNMRNTSLAKTLSHQSGNTPIKHSE